MSEQSPEGLDPMTDDLSLADPGAEDLHLDAVGADSPTTYDDDLDDQAYAAEEAARAAVDLDQPSATDDVPWSPPEQRPLATEFLDGEPETIDQRIAQEEPEAGTAYGAPESGAQLRGQEMLGGDDPDAVPAVDDVLDGPA